MLILAGSISSCGKTYCPAFPEHLVDYFPYKRGDTLLFINQHNDSLLFNVSALGKAEESSFEGLLCKCACPLNELFFTAIQMPDSWTEIKGFISADKYTKPFISFELHDGYFDKTTMTNSFLVLYEGNGKDPFDPKNKNLFGEVVVIENLKNQISRVVIVKGKGITEFYDQVYNFQWKNIKLTNKI